MIVNSHSKIIKQEDIISQLRSALELDSLPKITNQNEIANITNKFLSPANNRRQPCPQLIAIGGGPGSGKTFHYEYLESSNQIPVDAVIHDPDLVMQSIEQYREDALVNPIEAFNKWELSARQLSHEILFKALLAGYNIIYIRSFALTDSLNLMQIAKQFGYQIDIHLLTCDVNVALARTRKREQLTKRHIPSKMLIKRHEMVMQLIPDIVSYADNYYLYENNCNDSLPMLKEANTP